MGKLEKTAFSNLNFGEYFICVKYLPGKKNCNKHFYFIGKKIPSSPNFLESQCVSEVNSGSFNAVPNCQIFLDPALKVRNCLTYVPETYLVDTICRNSAELVREFQSRFSI